MRPHSVNMGLQKKAPPLELATSCEESIQAEFDGDCSLLSHFDTTNQSSVASNKSAALYRNLVARGRSRQYMDRKARKQTHNNQGPLHQLEQNNCQRDQILPDESDEKCTKSEGHSVSYVESFVSENKVLAVPEQERVTLLKSPACVTLPTCVVLLKEKTTFSSSLNTNIRELRDDAIETEKTSRVYPSVPDQFNISASVSSKTDFSHVNVKRGTDPLSGSRLRQQTNQLSNLSSNETAPMLSRSRSSQVVLLELTISKNVTIRELLLRQLKQTVSVIDDLAVKFFEVNDNLRISLYTLEASKEAFFSRMEKTDSLITLTKISHADEQANTLTKAKAAVKEVKASIAEVTRTLGYHFQHLCLLVTDIQQATYSIVEDISKWRQVRQRRRWSSNFHQFFRFSWRDLNLPNFLLHLNSDLSELFPSLALQLLLGPTKPYNPLLLSSATLQSLDISQTEKMRNDAGCVDNLVVWTNFSALKEIVDDLPCVAKLNDVAVDHKRVRHILEAIYLDKDLEVFEREQKEQRIQEMYDPFSTIKSAASVNEALDNVMALQSRNSQLQKETLRLYQQDTTRTALSSLPAQSNQNDPSRQALNMNLDRLQSIMMSPRSKTINEVRDRGQKNKPPCKMRAHSHNRKRIEHQLARTIQIQYRAHRQRSSLQCNLTKFVSNNRASLITIQRIFRGHRTRCYYVMRKKMWIDQQRKALAVGTIITAFRRYRQRLHHHYDSMTVADVMQQKQHSLFTKLDGHDTAERYRRIGEERRRQRMDMIQKSKTEQEEMERKRISAVARLQTVIRAHLAQKQVKVLRQNRKTHMNTVSAMIIQSAIRKFLYVKQEGRQRFQRNLNCSNKYAVRIQSIYRSYKSRSCLRSQLDQHTCMALNTVLNADVVKGENPGKEKDDGNLSPRDGTDDIAVADRPLYRLPPIAPSRCKANVRSSTNLVSLPHLPARDRSSCSSMSSTSTPMGRRNSIEMVRIELKLKEVELGDTFNMPPSRRNVFIGHMRRQT